MFMLVYDVLSFLSEKMMLRWVLRVGWLVK